MNPPHQQDYSCRFFASIPVRLYIPKYNNYLTSRFLFRMILHDHKAVMSVNKTIKNNTKSNLSRMQ